jgi:hypothetical protein
LKKIHPTSLTSWQNFIISKILILNVLTKRSKSYGSTKQPTIFYHLYVKKRHKSRSNDIKIFFSTNPPQSPHYKTALHVWNITFQEFPQFSSWYIYIIIPTFLRESSSQRVKIRHKIKLQHTTNSSRHIRLETSLQSNM